MMEHQERISLDEFSDESEQFEIEFDRFIAGESDESARARLIAKITAWLHACARQGQFIPLASADRRAFRSLLERWNSRLRDQGIYVEGIDSLADFDPRAGIVLTGECPYPGLEPYTQSRRGSFFGREPLVPSYVDHLEQQGNRILLIIGASGSGKSSLALAGVLPRLVELHDGAWLFGPRLTPGAHPLIEFAAAIALTIGQPDKAREIERALASNPGEAREQLAKLCQEKPLVLFIDQFEELLTMCRDADEQSMFAQVLCALSEPTVSSSGFCCRILLTLRTDHLARFESNNALKRLHMRLDGEDNQRYLSAIGFEDIKRAIKGPADEVGLRFIPATLIDQLASQTAGLSSGLPLLQFALRRLWDTRPENEAGEPLDLISEEMVKDLPDVERALSTVANGIFRAFSDQQQRICERLLLELIVLDDNFEEPLRRRRNEAELTQVLAALFPTSGDIASVIDEFVAAGLLRRFGEVPNSRLEVAHEALLRHWDHIYRLLTGADIKERLHLIKQIGREAGDWAGRGKSNDYLNLRGERLARAMTYGADGWLSEAEATAYVDACRAQEAAVRLKDKQASEEKERADLAQRAREEAELQALRARRNMWRLAVVAVLVFTVGFGLAWYRADKESFARELAMAAETELDLNSQRSLLLSIEAAKTLKGELLPEVERALRSAIRASRVTGVFKNYGKTSIAAVAYTPDGSVLALGDSLGGVTLWDVASGRQRKALFAHVDDVNVIAFSTDGGKMVSGSDDGRVVIWDTESWTPLHVLTGHVDGVTDLALSRPDGRLLATASDDASVRLWNVATGAPVGEALYGHSNGVLAVAFGRDQRQLVTAGDDGRVVVWDALEGRVLYSFVASDLSDIDLSEDGSLLAVATGSKVEIWNTVIRNRQWTLAGHTNSVFNVRFSPDHRQVATTSYDGTIRVWRLPRNDRDPQRQAEELARIRTEPTTTPMLGMITALAFSPGGDTVATTSIGGTATIWNVAAGGELLSLPGHETIVEAVAFSPNGRTIAAAGGRNVLAWDLSGNRQDTEFMDIEWSAKAVAFSQAGATAIGSAKDVLVALPDATEQKRLRGHVRVVNDLAFSPYGTRLVSGSHDNTAIVWELPSGDRLKTLIGHSNHVVAVAYSPDGKTIATGSKDNTIILWQADTFEQKHKIKGHYLGILDLAFTPDSKRLVSGSKDKTVRIWDIASGEQLTVFAEHTDVVNAVAIHGDRLATADDDTIRLWDLRTLAPVAVFPARSDGAQSLAFSPDGRYLAAGAHNGVVRVYTMQGKDLLEQANKRVHRGWTLEECQWFLQRNNCPKSRYSLLDEADRSFAKFEFEAGERLLHDAAGSGAADDETIHAEVDARLGTMFLWVASYALANPELWAEVAKDQPLAESVLTYLATAKMILNDSTLDPESRFLELYLYRFVQLGRRLARTGKREESITAFESARDAGWAMPSEPERAASQLFAVQTLTNASEAPPQMSPEDVRMLAKDIEGALERFPDIRPGHRVAAELYVRLNDYANAEKHYLMQADAKESSAEPFAELARLSLSEHEQSAVMYARNALDRDPGSDMAWYILGFAEYALKNEKKAVEAFDQVSPSFTFFADALNFAAVIYFEDLKNDQAAYQRLTRAVQLAPNDLSVLSNYAEFLLASGRDGQAKLAAVQAREHTDALLPGNLYYRVAMSFVVFTAELLSENFDNALAELDEIHCHVKAAAEEAEEAVAKDEVPQAWEYKGIRRSLERRSGAGPSEQRDALLLVLTFVESNGQKGTLDDMRQWLRSQPSKE